MLHTLAIATLRSGGRSLRYAPTVVGVMSMLTSSGFCVRTTCDFSRLPPPVAPAAARGAIRGAPARYPRGR